MTTITREPSTSALSSDHPLAGRKLWIPRMTYSGARMFAAVFRSIGIDSDITPPSNEETLELGGLYSSGEECYPEKVTLGDFIRIVRRDDFDPSAHAFFMPTADGPCRFGQYAPYLRLVLNELGYPDVPVVSPSSKNSYLGLADHAPDMIRRMWWGQLASDATHKLLLKTRPYETTPGDADEVYEQSLTRLDNVLSRRGIAGGQMRKDVRAALAENGRAFGAVPARYTKDRPLIGVVGEIYCRLNDFSNRDAIRRIEAHGGEAWLSDLCEWVWYTGWSHVRKLRREKKIFSREMLKAVLKNFIQGHDEHFLLHPLARDFTGLEEPTNIYQQVLKPGWPYLPADGALGEMALSVGKSVYLCEKGADGIIDISPFSCMNGIVSESVYHSLSRDHGGMPIRNFYFDATTSNMDRDLDIFMELARSYQGRKKRPRTYPDWFVD